MSGQVSTTRLLATTALLAVRAIRRHVLRSFLTVLGIVIGGLRGGDHGHAGQGRVAVGA